MTEPRQRLSSLLPVSLKRLLTVAVVLAGVMLANTLYLLVNRLADALGWTFFAVGETSLPKFFQTVLLTHTGVGLLLAVLMIAFFVTHLPKVWKRRHTTSIVSGIAYVSVGLILVVTGLFILTAAASRDNRWAWWAHVICAALVPIGYVVHRVVSYVRPPRVAFGRFLAAVGAVTVVLVALHGLSNRGIVRTREAQLALEQGLSKGPGARGRDVAQYLTEKFVPAAFVPPASPFFPSAATTTSGGYLPSRIITRGDLGSSPEEISREVSEHGFVYETPIGAETCVRCHQEIVAQWSTSAHRFASFNNPFYEATVNDMRTNATVPNAWVEQHIERFPDESDGVGRVNCLNNAELSFSTRGAC